MRTTISARKELQWIGCFAAAFIVAIFVLPYFRDKFVSWSKEKARSASCQSNERVIGLGLLQYSQDYDGYLPAGLQGKGIGWAGQVLSYMQSVGPFRCPDDGSFETEVNVNPSAHLVSYAMNRNLSKRRARIGELPNPKRTVIVFEVSGVLAQLDKPDEGNREGATSFSAVGDGTEGSLIAGTAQAQYSTGWMGNRPALKVGSQFDGPTGRHTGGANFLLGDGHVRWFGPNQVSTGSDANNKSDAQTGGIVGRAAGTQNNAFDATFSTE